MPLPPLPDRTQPLAPAATQLLAASSPTQGWSRHVALITGAGHSANGELAQQLHTRLRFLAPLAVLVYAYFAGTKLLAGGGLHVWPAAPMDRVMLVLVFLTLAVESVIAACLWRRRAWSLAHLRLWELALVALPLLHECCFQISDCWLTPAFWPALAGSDLRVLARGECLPWLVLIVSYGIIIPNTWRRCLLLVGTMAALALTINLAGAWSAPGLALATAAPYLAELAVWLLLGVALAVFIAARVDTLRVTVEEARKLGQYRLGRRLGAGGMGEVYLAEHAMLRRPCAIKIILPEHAAQPQVLQRFEREVRTTATLTHPHTVQVFDYGRTDDGTFYYVMEYLPGLSLDQLVKRHGPLPPARAAYLLQQVCGALAEAHAAGLIHRDLKPGNIIVCVRGGVADHAKLLDFGLVVERRADDSEQQLTQAGAILGTPAYMSPEQALGQEAVDARSDLYGLGAVAYFLLSGHAPFKRASALQVMMAHLNDPPPPLIDERPDIPADLQAVVLRCLAKDPAARYQTAVELGHAFAQCLPSGDWGEAHASAWWQANPVPDLTTA